MEIANTTLMNEIQLIMSEVEKAVHFYWECQIKAGPNTLLPYKLLNLDIIRDYGNNYADEIILEVMIGGGTFAHEIMPYKEDIKVILAKIPITSNTTDPQLQVGISFQEFRATLTQVPGDNVAPTHPHLATAQAGDLASIRTITFQLQDISLEQIRFMTLGTSVRRAIPAEVLRALVNKASAAINVDQANKIKGLTMVEEHNREPRDHVIIPHGTPLVKVPDYLQDQAGGIYSAGLGFYLQKDMWYVWPLFDLSRFDKSPKTVTLILLPTRQLDSIERTFRTTANQTIILITGGARHRDNSEQNLSNAGNGARFADSRKIMEGFGEVSNNRVVAKRTYNNNEFVGITRATGLNNVKMTGITNNVFAQASALARRKGSILIANWQNSDPDLLRPDIPVQVIYPKDGLPASLNATLLHTHSFISSNEAGIANRRHMCNTAITLFVEKDLPELKEYENTKTGSDYAPAFEI